MNLHLFSFPGEDGLRHIVDASRPFLENKSEPVVAYLPIGTLYDTYQEYTEKAFHGLARVETLNTEMMSLQEMEAILRRASVAYIPGGNTFLLSHRLHVSKIMEYLMKKVAAGLPVVAFSAGTVLCGPNILTSNDMNIVPTTYFKGLQATPFNLNVHYPKERLAQADKDEWLAEYHIFQDNPVILLCDGSSVKADGRITSLEQGEAWILRKGQEKELLTPGAVIQL